MILLTYPKITQAFSASDITLLALVQFVINKDTQIIFTCGTDKSNLTNFLLLSYIIFLLRYRISHFFLLNLILFILTHHSSLPDSFLIFSFFSKVLHNPHCVFFKFVHYCSFRLLIKMLNRIRCWGTLFKTSVQSAVELVISTLGMVVQ